MTIEDVLVRLTNVTKTGRDQYRALCPAHADKTPSLSIGFRVGKGVLLRCWSGCSFAEITNALGIDPKDLFDPQNQSLPSQLNAFSCEYSKKLESLGKRRPEDLTAEEQRRVLDEAVYVAFIKPRSTWPRGVIRGEKKEDVKSRCVNSIDDIKKRQG